MARRLTLYQFAQRLIHPAGIDAADVEALAREIGRDAFDELNAALQAAGGFVRLPPDVAASLGFTRSSRRYVRAGEPITREATLSMRRALESVAGERRERSTARRREGSLPYKSPRARENVAKARIAKQTTRAVPDIAPADRKLIVKWRTGGGYQALRTRAEKARFKTLFDRYPHDRILEAIGSPVTKRRGRK